MSSLQLVDGELVVVVILDRKDADVVKLVDPDQNALIVVLVEASSIGPVTQELSGGVTAIGIADRK